MNKLLQRQINKHIGEIESLPENVLQLLEVVSNSYEHYEKDRKIMERSIEMSSMEMTELNIQLRQETEESSKIIFEKLKQSLDLLHEKEKRAKKNPKHLTLEHIADLLKNEIEKRRNAESKTKRSELHLKASQRIAHIGSWELCISMNDATELTPVYLSDETYRILGYTPNKEETKPGIFYSRVHPDDIAKVKQAAANAINNSAPFNIEHRIVLPDGKEKIIHARAEVIYEAATQRPLRMMGTIQDITERKKSNEKLQQANHELRILFENMHEMYFSVDFTTFQLIQMSEACEEIYGYSVEEFRQNPNLWYELAHEEDKKSINDNYALMYAGNSFTHEHRIHHKSGCLRWVRTRIKPTLNEEGKVIRIDGITSDITESKEAEIALLNSEHRFRSLIENSTDVITVINENQEAIFASDSIYQVTGFKPEEVVNTRSFEAIHPDDRQRAAICWNTLLEKPEQIQNFAYRRLKKDGSYIWVESTIKNLFNDSSVKGIVINFRDITEKKETERILKDSEHKFRSLIENSSDIITIIDEHLNTVFASDSIYRLAGYRPEEVVGKDTVSFVHPDDNALALQYIENILKIPGEPLEVTYRIRKKNGDYIWCERIGINLLHDPAIRGIVSNIRDVTAFVENQQILKNSEHRFRSLIQNSSDVIIVTNEKLERVFVSDSILHITGFTPGEMLGQKAFGLAHPDYQQLVHEHIEKVFANSGKPQNIIYKACKKDGSFYWCERVTVNLLQDPAVNGIVSNIRDVTERIEREEALKASNEDLKKTNMELDKFVYSVSHDLRAPLSSILGLAEYTEAEAVNPEVIEGIRLIKASAKKLDGFIQDILDYSRNARGEIKKEKINFTDLLDGISDDLKFMSAANTKVAIKTNIQNGFDFYSDRGRIAVVLNNLISNAIRYHNPDATDPFVEIDIQLNKKNASIRINDNGIGIGKDNHEKVFKMFYRVSTKSVGSGLGLYIVKETIEKLKGTICLESEPGKGTTFKIEIPNLINN